jgi:azurin
VSRRPRVRLLAVPFVLAIAAAPAVGAGQRSGASPRTITLTVADPVDGRMAFTPDEITAKPGERLRVTLVSVATMPKESMGHNWVLLKLGVDPKAFTDDAVAARATDFLPPARQAQIVAHIGLVGPGERASVTFTVPAAAGKYPFVCSFAGHFAAGMSGVLVVK